MSAHFASASEPAEIRPGTRLGRFEILLGIAQGGMARVWAARQQGHRGFSKIVAIKTILPTLSSDPTFEAMFLDEARVAASVHHPNVCQIFDLGEDAGVLYLAMEWVNGESLARILKPPAKSGSGKREPERLNARIAARIIADAAAGLHAAHELADESGQHLGVVHRDVSPQNILVSLTGNVKVTDFGVAKALGMNHEATAAGQVKGKAAYMSPEQATGGEIDRRSDIFALGIVLYEITTGQRPFHGENQVAVLKSLLDGRFDPPSAIVPGYPRELEAVVLRALSIDRAGRFESADRMRIALEEWLARSGPVVTETQVGTLVRQRVGKVIEERQTKIRERSKAAVDPHRASQASFPPASEISSSNKISEPSAVSHVAPTGSVPGSSRPELPMVTPSSASPAVQLPSSPTAASVPSAPAATSVPPPPAVVASMPAPAPVRAVAAAPARQTTPGTLIVGLGVVVLCLFALLGVGIWALVGSDDAPAPAAATTATATAKTTALPDSTETAAPEPKQPVPAEAEWIQIEPVEPKQGVSFELDGKPLTGKLQIERPEPGQVKLLTAKADGYHDEIFRIEDGTPDQLDILLAKKYTASGAPTPPPPREPKSTASDKPNKPPIKPDIPDNPF